VISSATGQRQFSRAAPGNILMAAIVVGNQSHRLDQGCTAWHPQNSSSRADSAHAKEEFASEPRPRSGKIPGPMSRQIPMTQQVPTSQPARKKGFALDA